jgi:hypothetical protein
VAIASLIGIAIGIAIRRSASQDTSNSQPPPVQPPPSQAHPVVVATGALDAGPETRPDAGSRDATSTVPPTDAGLAPVSPVSVPRDAATAAPIHVPPPVHNPAAEEHLRNAEDAFHGNNVLKQLAEADLALRANPRSVRAKFLLADALIKGGDLDRGCAYLRTLKRNQVAQDRARAAGCPGD